MSDLTQKANRPLSPHLQVYKLPYNAKMSIAGRGVGIALAAVVTLIFLCVIAVAWVPAVFAPLMAFLHLPVIGYLMLAASFVVFFYLGNGVRHVLWDCVIGVHHKCGFKTANITLIVSALLTILLTIAAFQSPVSVKTDVKAAVQVEKDMGNE